MSKEEQYDKKRQGGGFSRDKELARRAGAIGGKSGGNGLQKLTFEERSRNSKRYHQKLKERLREKEIEEELNEDPS